MVAIKAKPKLKAKPSTKVVNARPPSDATDGLERSDSLKIFKVPVDKIVEHKGNPNQQSEATFNELVEKIKADGLDEPIIVVPHLEKNTFKGKFMIVSGHHRYRACKAAGLTHIDCVIRQGWDEDKADLELIARNQLRGQMDPEKFTKLYNKLAKKYDPEFIKRQMGFTSKQAFDKVFMNVRAQLGPREKKKLDEAKEEIKSVDDLTSVLNNIFKEHGAQLDHGFIVFSFAGKDHIYVKGSKELKAIMAGLMDQCEKDGATMDTLLLARLSGTTKTVKPLRRVKDAPAKADE